MSDHQLHRGVVQPNHPMRWPASTNLVRVAAVGPTAVSAHSPAEKLAICMCPPTHEARSA